jgi:hypothetical protein
MSRNIIFSGKKECCRNCVQMGDSMQSSTCKSKFTIHETVIASFPQSFCASPATHHESNSFSSATVRYSDRREIDMSPWIYSGITGDFETLRSWRLAQKKKGKKKKHSRLPKSITNPTTRTNNSKMSDACFISKSAYSVSSSTVKLETAHLFETLITIYQTTRHYVPEDSNSIFTTVRTPKLCICL